MLALKEINVFYGGSHILRNVSLEVPPRQVVCLMGRNGVGKTTTLKTIVGLLNSSSGEIHFESQPVSTLTPDARARLGIGYVPQGRDIFPNLTVWENLKLSLVVHGKKSNGEVDRILELFPNLKTMLNRKGGILSGGQQQQLAIARSLLTNPKLLMLDEPTEGIQPNIIDEIGETIRRIKAETHLSILLVEQYLDFALALADTFYVMDKGAIVANGPIAHLNEEVVRKHLTV